MLNSSFVEVDINFLALCVIMLQLLQRVPPHLLTPCGLASLWRSEGVVCFFTLLGAIRFLRDGGLRKVILGFDWVLRERNGSLRRRYQYLLRILRITLCLVLYVVMKCGVL